MTVAYDGLQLGGAQRVREEIHRPKVGETDLLWFEWHFFYRQSHAELLTLETSRSTVAYSPDGKLLATAAHGTWNGGSFAQAEVKVWDAKTGKALFTFESDVRQSEGVIFSPDGKRIACAARPAKVWDVTTGRELFS